MELPARVDDNDGAFYRTTDLLPSRTDYPIQGDFPSSPIDPEVPIFLLLSLRISNTGTPSLYTDSSLNLCLILAKIPFLSLPSLENSIY